MRFEWWKALFRFALNMKRLEREWQVGDGREQEVLDYVKMKIADRSPDAVLALIDEYASQKKILINVGNEKGKILDNVIQNYKPKLALELGAYVGYSAIRMGRLMQGGKLISVEFNEANAKIARQMIDLAGLSQTVEVIHGYLGDDLNTIRTLENKHEFHSQKVDFVFLDHAKEAYLSDLKLIMQREWLHPGSVLVADNVKFPGAPEYFAYMKAVEGKEFKTTVHNTYAEYQRVIRDKMLVSVKI